MRRAYAETSWGQIHYRFEGRGATLLLLHPTPSSSLTFEKAIPIFARQYQVVAMDTLGYGLSDRPSREMEISDYADSVAAFLDTLGVDQANVLGSHTGAGIAIEFAASYPGRVIKLIIDGAPYWEPEELKHMANNHAPPLIPKDDGSHLLYLWERAKKTAPNAGPELWQRRVMQTLMAGDYYNSAYDAIFKYDILSRLPLIKCPTLLMCGEYDVLRAANNTVLPLIPRVWEVIIPGGGGMMVDLKTEEYTRTVLDFLVD